MTISSRSRHATTLDWTVTIATAAIVTIFIVQRVVTTGLLGDELLFYHAIDLGFPQSLLAPGSSHPPLFRLIVDLSTRSNSPDWMFRLPSCLLAIGTVFIWQRVLLRLVDDHVLRCLILPAMALNPIWLNHSYQCLPYAPLTFAASLHCLAWMRMLEAPNLKTNAAFVATAAVLPWIHFYGIHVLLADQFVWLMLWLNGGVAPQVQNNSAAQEIPATTAILRKAIWLNVAIAVLTLPVVPIVLFYLLHDRGFPLHQIADYGSYFFNASSYFFSTVTFPETPMAFPILALVYSGIILFLGKFCIPKTRGTEDQAPEIRLQRSYGILAISLVLGSFTAAQLHSFLSQTATWPRYMLAGAWVILPLILFLLSSFQLRKFAYIFAIYCTFLSVKSILAIPGSVAPGSDYQEVASYIDQSHQPQDAFLVQSMDFWIDENHFDRIWYERYTDGQLRMTSGIHVRRAELQESGLNLNYIDPGIERIWIYSHLITKTWLETHKIPGWQVAEVKTFQDKFPVALLERTAETSVENTQATLKR